LSNDELTLSRKRVESLLDRLCVELGYCLKPESCEEIAGNPPRTVNKFANAVLKREFVHEHSKIPADVLIVFAKFFDLEKKQQSSLS
jgi:hypothetical protein